MRHRIAGRRLGRDSEHRVAMRRNIVSSLFEHETISTTVQKAKEIQPFAEKLITTAKKGDLAARRRVISLLGNRNIVSEEDGITVKKGTVVGKLFSEIAPRYLDRPGGYTRIIRLAMRRLGDNGELVLLQLVGADEGKKKKSKSKKADLAKDVVEVAEAVVEEAEAKVENAQPEVTDSEKDKDTAEKEDKK